MWGFKWWRETRQAQDVCLLHTKGSKYDVASPAVHSALSVRVVGMQIWGDGCIWSGPKGMSQRGKGAGCGRSKTNGPIKSFKGAAIYLSCVTGWRFTSLIRAGTYQLCFLAFQQASPIQLIVSGIREAETCETESQQQYKRAATPKPGSFPPK